MLCILGIYFKNRNVIILNKIISCKILKYAVCIYLSLSYILNKKIDEFVKWMSRAKSFILAVYHYKKDNIIVFKFFSIEIKILKL